MANMKFTCYFIFPKSALTISRLTAVTVPQLMGPDMLGNPPSLGYYYRGTQKEAIFFEIIYLV